MFESHLGRRQSGMQQRQLKSERESVHYIQEAVQ